MYDLRVALGNVVMPIWNAVMPGLIALANALTAVFNKIASVVNGILSLFGLGLKGGSSGGGGGGFLGDVADVAEDIGSSLSDGLGGMSSGAEKVKDSLGKGAEAANDIVKATKELMGIDELNLLDSSDSGSGSGGSGGSGGGSGSPSGGGVGGSGGGLGGGLGDLSSGLDNSKSAIESIARELATWEKVLLDVFQHLKIGFMQFANEIIGEWTKLKNNIEKLGQAMADFFYQCWENGLDRVVIMIGGIVGAIVKTALQIANAVVQVVTGLFNHLNPNSNENTQKFIKALGDLLLQVAKFIDDVGDYFSQFATACQPFIDNLGDIAMIVGTILMQVLADSVQLIRDFMGSWVGQALIEGVAGALEWLSGVLEACLGFIRDNLEFIEAFALGILGVVGAIKLINTVMGLWNAVMLIWNGISVITTGLASALAGAIAFITSPIGLVILAIGALIAIGVLLWKNWDKVKEMGKQIWSKIVSWFNEAGVDIEGILKQMWQNAKKSFETIKTVATTIFKAVWSNMKAIWEAIKNIVSTTVKSIYDVIKNVFNLISSVIQLVMSIIVGIFTGDWSYCKDMVVKVFNAIKDTISSVFTGAYNIIKSIITNIKNVFQTGFNNAKSVVCSVFDGIKNAIKDKIEWARDKVKGAIEKIKGFFNFSWSLPKIKLPHFSMTGKFSLDPPSIPKIGVQWYKNGCILTKPTIFGMNGNNLMAGGEFSTGGEAILPLNKLFDELGQQFDKQNKVLSKGNNNNNNQRPIQVQVVLDGKVIAQSTIKEFKDQSRRGVLDTSWL